MRILLLASVAALTATALAAQPATDPPPAGLTLFGPTGNTRQATVLSSEIRIDVTGMVARTSIRQRFRNASSDWVEGIYVLPLPDDSAVDRLAMIVGDRRIEGEIRERDAARRTYEQARAAGQQASLVEQERPNLFTTSLANIAPRDEIVVEIRYFQNVAYADGSFSLRVPLTLTPRFIPAGSPAPREKGVRGIAAGSSGGVADADRITPPVLADAGSNDNRATIEVTVDAGVPLESIQSSTHPMTAVFDGRRYTLATAAGDVPMDRDFVLDWRLVEDQNPRVAVFTETVRGATYALLMLLPPTTTALPETTPREAVFVIDTSGSMSGASLRQARSALALGLERLAPGDRFNVIEFNSAARALFAAPVAVTEQNLERARRFVAGLAANGGTNVADALELALREPVTPGWLRQIVFVTDGSVGNEAELFRMVRQNAGESRIFTVGIGSAPNTHFMRKTAEFGRGSYSHIGRIDEVEPAMRRLLAQLEHVALRDLEIVWPAAAETYPERIPDLYLGQPIVVTARFEGTRAGNMHIEAGGQTAQYPWTAAYDVAPTESAGVAALWARRRIESLVDRRLEGEPEAEIRAAVVEVALAHGLLSPYTSLVAVDRTPERSRNAALRREALGNLPPAGSGARYALLPNTASDAGWFELLGTVLAALALGLGAIWRMLRLADQ